MRCRIVWEGARGGDAGSGVRAFPLLLCLASLACAPPRAAPPPASAVAPRTVAVDTLYVAPEAFDAALAPLVVHRRSQGLSVEVVTVESLSPTPDARAIRAAIEARADHVARVLVVGDAQRDDEPLDDRCASQWSASSAKRWGSGTGGRATWPPA